MQISFKEKEGSGVGKRVRAVGMYYFSIKDLKVGKVYSIRRNMYNKKDSNCLEITDGVHPKAVINKDVAKIISPLLDNNKLDNAECEVIEEAKWTKGDSGIPARAHKVKVSVTFSNDIQSDPEFKTFVELINKEYRQD